MSSLLHLTIAILMTIVVGVAPAIDTDTDTDDVAGPVAASSPKKWIEVTNDADEHRLIFTIGPIDLPARSGHHGVEQPPLLTASIPVNGYLYGFDVEMVDGEGRQITQRLLHHVNLIDPSKRELFSPVALRLFAAGSETRPASMPKVLGVPVESGQRLMVSSMFYNPTDRSYPDARLRVILKYREEGWVFPMEVYPVYVDVTGYLGKKDFDLPPGRSEWSWEGSPAVEGRLLGAGGHLHDHAEQLVFRDLTTGEVLWQTRPVVDERGRTVGVPVGKFWWKGGIKLTPDHTYRLEVIYENPTGQTIADGGMGVLGGVFKPAGPWPVLDPDDPRYQANLESTRNTADRRAAGMAGHEGASDHGH